MKLIRGFFLVILHFCASQIISAQTTDEIVAKHIDAIGGREAWNKVSSLKIDGTLNVQGTEIQISSVHLHGQGMRQDITVQGVSGYQILTPTEGWTFLPFQGQNEVVAMSADEVKQSQNELDTHGSLLDYKDKGHSAEFAGMETIQGTDCYKIVLSLNSGKTETLYIDPRNYYLVRSSTKQTVNGEVQEMQTNYSAFEKTPEGIVLAKSLTLPYGTMTLTNVEVNVPVNEKLFKPVSRKDTTREPE